jgi:phosphotransacetylase
VVRADEVETLAAVKEAVEGGMVDCVLVGPESGIRAAAEEAGFDLNGVRGGAAPDDHDSSFRGVDLIRKGEAGSLMTGLVATSTFLKAVLDRDHGIRGEGLLSHVAAFEVPGYHKLLIITDAAMNIAPDFDQKGDAQDAIEVACSLGIDPEGHLLVRQGTAATTRCRAPWSRPFQDLA